MRWTGRLKIEIKIIRWLTNEVDVLSQAEIVPTSFVVFGIICRISASGSFIKVAMRLCAWRVASADPLKKKTFSNKLETISMRKIYVCVCRKKNTYFIVMLRSPCPLLCFSTSIWAPVAPRIALILLPPRPITREIAFNGTDTFLVL